MNMTQSNIRLLLAVFGVGILIIVWMYVYKPNMEDKSSIDDEISVLENRYNELKAQEVHRDEYIALTKEYNEKFAEAIEVFPATLDQEISVMFMKGIEKDQGNLQMNVQTVGLGREELFYTLGGGVTPEVVEGDEEVATVPAGETYDCYRAIFPITYQGSYEGIKDLIDYVMAYKYRMNITSVNISYDPAEDQYAGTITLNCYSVAGGDREADKVTTDVSNGVSNIFLGGAGASVPASSGASSVSASSNDVKITLNNANGDSTSGVVVAAGSKSLTYEDNDVTTVDVKVEENDGKKVATISLNGKDVTVDIADDAASFGIFVASSARVDSDDTNGIKLNVTNDTNIAVEVVVDGDDSSSPRFTMGSKSGTVKVN